MQRVLGARDEQHARVGPLFAGLIKVLPVFIFVLPGLFAFTLVQSGELDVSSLWSVNEEGERIFDSKGIYGVMITQLLPQGVVGLMVAALLAALMSTVAGALNSISTLFSYDLYKRFRPQASDHQLVLVGRLTAGVALVAAIGLVPLLDGYPSIFNGLNDIIAHIAPPITTVFVLGVFWRGASAQSAKLTLWLGSLLGAATYVAGKLGSQYLGEGNLDCSKILRANALHDEGVLPALCMRAHAGDPSLLSTRSSIHRRVRNCTGRRRWEPLRAKGWPGIGNYKLHALLLVGAVSALYYWFR